MTEATSLIELAERVEAATGPDRELDALAHQVLGYRLRDAKPNERYQDRRRWVRPDGLSCGWMEDAGNEYPPHYTASIDAAMSLLRDDTFFHVSRFSTDEGADRGQAHVYPNRYVGDDYEGSAATPALALCAAALRARASL